MVPQRWRLFCLCIPTYPLPQKRKCISSTNRKHLGKVLNSIYDRSIFSMFQPKEKVFLFLFVIVQLQAHLRLIVCIELKLSVDATPSYISSRFSCQRISSSLPYVKLVILFREPVSRAYSEYQMKSRRVKNQQEFFELILENHKQFRLCFNILAAQHHVSWNRNKCA